MIDSKQYHAHEDAMHQFMIDLGKGKFPHITKGGGSILDAINIFRLGIQDEPIEVIRNILNGSTKQGDSDHAV